MTRDSKLPLLMVDGGGLLFERVPPSPRELEQARVAAEGLVAGYNQIGYAAVGVAGRDLAGGLDFLKAQADRAKFAWLSANLVEPGSDKPLFTPYLSRKLGETRLAIIGLTSEQADPALLQGASIKPWGETLARLVPELARNHDFLVLLTDLPPTVCGTLAQQYPAINLIINAFGEAYNQPPRALTPSTLLAATGRQGKYVGGLEITWSRGGRWGEGESRFLALRDKEAELQRTSRLLAEVAKQPGQESQSGNLRRRQGLLQEEIDELSSGLAGVPAAFFASTFTAMAATVGEEPQVAALVAQVRERIGERGRKHAQAAGEAGASALPEFTGWRACAPCHPQAAARWQSTGHSAAYLTLEKKNRQFDVNCLICHVTGGEVVPTDRMAVLPPEFHGVGCEVCHGPGRRHAEGKEKNRPRRVAVTLCQGCHAPEHDGDFDYGRDVERIRCDR